MNGEGEAKALNVTLKTPEYAGGKFMKPQTNRPGTDESQEFTRAAPECSRNSSYPENRMQ